MEQIRGTSTSYQLTIYTHAAIFLIFQNLCFPITLPYPKPFVFQFLLEVDCYSAVFRRVRLKAVTVPPSSHVATSAIIAIFFFKIAEVIDAVVTISSSCPEIIIQGMRSVGDNSFLFCHADWYLQRSPHQEVRSCTCT
jgi:hypothetical protein